MFEAFKEYPATVHPSRSIYGVEMDIKVPKHKEPVLIAQDVFGDKDLRMQILIYPPCEYDPEIERAISIRFNPNGSIAEVIVPTGTPVESWDASSVSKWSKERDGI